MTRQAKQKRHHSPAWNSALAAVENVPATAGGVRSRNVFIGYRRTSVRFDAPTWRALAEIMR